ncbi:TPA: pyridoxamine 5'-phosphate oxidase family protein [Salmonella enterica]|uniref:Pyridoxamine 5'-phosphate oxidase family protein n=1 Tax=Salmonella enterica TaxID=28901 RepID=A0A760BFP4_SALER|nr:pyridoxamine 5'-phosphate oxidase family protein [Salmonella enterica]EBZ8404111.1 pyridoxamine 5'-phosphate oxidase family protein [Salmonella enterica subsp. enterica serovar Muenchen]ECF1924441.1 pyridoxamine 5'-phosphate oxidase family protein [Salmonella enterica subsp. enterica serovar Newport]HEB6458356.1 pyridoxamine 5'-phosphate oxidase family protein [Salmonella enterica subsp. enterica serovar Hvittingfoss]EBI1477378.1 pyridoxamine 5'-phosphate oxidase family protein [Salmonella e
MTNLDEKMKAMLAVQLPVQATTGENGLPDIGPKRSLRVYNDTTLIYNENTGGRTLQNIRAGSKMAVAVIDRENRDGYRFICTPVIAEDGDAYQNALDFAQNNGMQQPLCAVVLKIDEIYSLRSGADAGKKIQ